MKKIMKKAGLLAMAVIVMIAFSSCGCSNKEAEKSTKDGSVIYCEAGELLMVTTASEVLSFNVENAEIESLDTINFGDLAEVEYTGEITDGDTSECTVTNVTIVSADLLYDEAEKATSSDTKDKKKSEKAKITAVSDVVYVTASNVAVRDGYDITANRIGTVNTGDKLTRTGKVSNGWSRIKYDGKDAFVIDKYLTTKTAKKDKKKDKKKKQKKEKKKEKKKKSTCTMNATVKSVEDDVLYLDTATGNEFEFEIGDAEVTVDLEPGTEVVVKFRGSEAQPGKLLKVSAQ